MPNAGIALFDTHISNNNDNSSNKINGSKSLN